ncbi:MAG: response regulator transcription factor [Elusimicrobia bacterium]|nr:response regulator transcription factor [Elusimicrobiota bacterium]
MYRPKILLIEDDKNIKTLLEINLEGRKYNVHTAESLAKAREELNGFTPDIMILDRKLPDGDGIDFCREIRSYEKTKHIPILFLTAMSKMSDKLLGLRIGGDDYLTKPFDIEELVARVEAIFRRLRKTEETLPKILKTKGIELNLNSHECFVKNTKIKLWPKEFETLKIFLEKKNKLMTKDYLSENIWGWEHSTYSRNIDITIQRLRKKLGKQGSVIETVKGYGYILRED